MRVDKKLVDLTNKFIEDFLGMAGEGKRDDLYHFNYTMADAISQSNYPRYSEDDELTCLLGMSSFDDSLCKGFFNNRIQGFIKIIEKRIEMLEDQDDYLVTNVKKLQAKKEVDDIDFDLDNGKMINIRKTKKEVDTEKISFNVSNSKSGFSGNAIINRSNHIYGEIRTENVKFYTNGNKIMEIDYDSDGKERGTFTHYKYISDINSFFLVLKFS